MLFNVLKNANLSFFTMFHKLDVKDFHKISFYRSTTSKYSFFCFNPKNICNKSGYFHYIHYVKRIDTEGNSKYLRAIENWLRHQWSIKNGTFRLFLSNIMVICRKCSRDLFFRYVIHKVNLAIIEFTEFIILRMFLQFSCNYI